MTIPTIKSHKDIPIEPLMNKISNYIHRNKAKFASTRKHINNANVNISYDDFINSIECNDDS
jgi:hypothetical protein